ncbi:MAG: hypothetical protein OXI75_09115 [Rhodospirillales bacterium]|nr:hypothetical protein [Rhodospirillales bacterium]
MGTPSATVANRHSTISISPCASVAKMGVQGIGPYVFMLNALGQGAGAGMAKYAFVDRGSHAGKGGPESPPPLRLIFEDFTQDLYGS